MGEVRDVEIDLEQFRQTPEQMAALLKSRTFAGPIDRTCETCRFSVSETVGPNLDFPEPVDLPTCHRYPQSFPVKPGHWCGEWQVEEGVG